MTVYFYILTPESGEITTTVKSFYNSIGTFYIEESDISTSGLALSTEKSLLKAEYLHSAPEYPNYGDLGKILFTLRPSVANN